MFEEFISLSKTAEELIDKRTVELNKVRMQTLQKYGYSGLEIDDDNEEIRELFIKEGDELWWYEDITFPILRRYIFVATYQSFERLIFLIFKQIADKRKIIPFEYQKKFIYSCREYLKNVVRIDNMPEGLWHKIYNYNNFRNCIIHYGGQARNNTLRKFAKENPFLYYEEMDEQIYCKKGFTEEAIKYFDLFLMKLSELRDIPI